MVQYSSCYRSSSRYGQRREDFGTNIMLLCIDHVSESPLLERCTSDIWWNNYRLHNKVSSGVISINSKKDYYCSQNVCIDTVASRALLSGVITANGQFIEVLKKFQRAATKLEPGLRKLNL